MIALKSFLMEQLHVIKKSVEDFRSENVTTNNLELIETLKEKIRKYKNLMNENITKTYITKYLNQATGYGKATTTPKVHQQETAIQTEVIRRQEKINPQNSHENSKSLPNRNVRKSGNNPSLKQNKEDVKEKNLNVGDSLVKHIDGWRLNKRVMSTVSVRSIPGATTKGMIHHVKCCLEDTSPDFIILHHGTNDLNDNSTSEEIADKTLNLAASIKIRKNQVFVSSLVIRNDKLNKKGNEINELLKNKYGIRQLSFIDYKNISLGMSSKSGVHLNENGTTHLVNNFCHSTNA